MTRIIFTLLTVLFLTAANVHAVTLHVLWITATNETGNSDLRLEDAQNPKLELSGQYCDERKAEWQPLEELGHTVVEYTFGSGKDCPLEKNAILRFIGNMSISPNDAVMVYYRGHGGYDEEYRGDKKKEYLAQQHYVFRNDTEGQDYLSHSEIRLAVEKLQPRLSVFVRDCCGSWCDVPKRGVAPDREATVPYHEPTRQIRQELFLSLFVHSSGVVDISAAKAGLAALAQPVPEFSMDFEPTEKYYQYGTILSNSFAEVFEKNRHRGLTWEVFCGQLKGNVEQRFVRFLSKASRNDVELYKKECDEHTPRFAVIGGIYAVPDFSNRLAKSTIPPNYFGFEGVPVYGGVRLTRIPKGSRGEAYGLETDDIIHQVDGIMVTTNKELDLACRVLGDDGKIKFTLVDKNTGDVLDFAFPDIRAAIK
jgi:hypothetical protein